jgi:phosphohistidine phosphatase
MKTLFLLRHAKSSWADPQLSDFDRPLNERGLRAAPFMGEIMRNRGYRPEVIISSPASRAKNTALLVAGALGTAEGVQFEGRLYEASPQTFLSVARSIPDDYSSAMLVGHNPGTEGFVRLLTGKREPMPTAALAVIEIAVELWADTDMGGGNLKEVLRPKEISD